MRIEQRRTDLDFDSGTVTYDAGSPGYDAGSEPEASVPDATVTPQPDSGQLVDASEPDTSRIHDATPGADVFDAGPQGQIRIAYLDDPAYVNISLHGQSPGATTYDVCVAVHGTGVWQGPLLQKAGSPGLSLFDVSTYFDVPAGQYDVRLLTIPGGGGTATCDAADGATDFTSLPAIAGGARMTAVVLPVFSSETTGSVNVVALNDDTTVTTGKTKVRFVNGSGTGYLDYGLGGGDVFTPVLTQVSNVTTIAVANDDAGTNVGANANGYVEIDPFTQIDTTAQGSVLDTANSPAIDAPAGTIVTAFAVYSSALGGTGLIVCNDTQTNTSNPLLSSCTVVSGANGNNGGVLRFTNFISDTSIPNVDFCIKYHSSASYGPTSVGGGVEGVPFATGSERYDVHAGFTYDIRLVAGAATDCTSASAVAPDFSFVAPSVAAVPSTIALTGSVAALDGGSPTDDTDGGSLASTAFAAVALTDVGCLGTETPPSVRVVNVASAAAQAQSASLSGGNSWEFDNIPYGGIGSTKGTDACGYLSYTAPEGTGFIATDGEDSAYTNTSQTETLYLFSIAADAVQILACDDEDSTENACAVLNPGG